MQDETRIPALNRLAHDSRHHRENFCEVLIPGSRADTFFSERVMGLEPTDGTLGRYCLTTWLHPPRTYDLYLKSTKSL